MTIATYEIGGGDIPPAQLLTANYGGIQDMSAAGWECWSQVIFEQSRLPLFAERRQIFDLELVDGLSQFKCSLVDIEAALLKATPDNTPLRYRWVIEVSNLALPYRRESEFVLLVRSNGAFA